jgi:hypothetical protein
MEFICVPFHRKSVWIVVGAVIIALAVAYVAGWLQF